MTDEAQRIAIAEFCGFVNQPVDFNYMGESGTVDCWRLYDKGGKVIRSGLPEYLKDHNAIYEAEGKLNAFQIVDYLRYLQTITRGHSEWSQFVHVEPRHCAEAFLKAIGKWEA